MLVLFSITLLGACNKSVKKDIAKTYQCPMKCEGEKLYAENVSCPVCNMDLKPVAESTKLLNFEISDNDGCKLIAIIESYQIELKERVVENEQGEKKREIYNAYILEANPLGTIQGNKFTRGGDALTIPPTEVEPASEKSIKLIYENGFEPQEKFLFAKLAQDENIETPVNGNKFFNKHFAIVGSTGSGKTATTINMLLQLLYVHNPRLYLITALPTFGLFGDFLDNYGFKVNRIQITKKSQPSLPPFADITLIETGSDGDPNNTIIADAGDRNILGEAEIVAKLMLTGGREKELDKYDSHAEALVSEAIQFAAKTVVEENGNQTIFSLEIPANVWLPRLRKIRTSDFPLLYDSQAIENASNDPGSPIGVGKILVVELLITTNEGKTIKAHYKRAFHHASGE